MAPQPVAQGGGQGHRKELAGGEAGQQSVFHLQVGWDLMSVHGGMSSLLF
jgi:hypothetical protein